ncbi:MAG: hypothetical protein IKU39_03705 [Lachnospiraceae bacterium]|nr:hypothetical protein [Lachnospiraceae bacterium]
MSRTKKFLVNTITAAIYQVVVLGAGIIIPQIMLLAYGSEVNGLVSSITQFINYFNLVEAGLAGAAVFALYGPLANKDYKAISSVLSATQNLYKRSGYIFLILLAVFSFIYPMFIESQYLSPVWIGILVLILGTSGVLEFFTLGKYRAILTADQKQYVISIASIIYQLLMIIIIAVLARLRVNIVITRLLSLVAVYSRSIILALYTRKKYPFINYNAIPAFEAINKRWDAMFLQILGAIHTGSPIILATIFTNLLDVSVYSIYNMVLAGIGGVVGIFTSGLSAAFGDVIAKKEYSILKRTYREFQVLYYSLIVVVYGVTTRMLIPFISLYTKSINDTNYIIESLALLFVINGFLHNLKTPQGMLIISAGHYRETRIQTSVQGLLAVSVGMALAPRYGLQGILIGSIVSNIYRCIDLMVYVPRNIVHDSANNTAFKMLKSIAVLIILIITTSKIPFEISTYVDWIISAIMVTIYASIIVIVSDWIFERDEILGIMKRIFK